MAKLNLKAAEKWSIPPTIRHGLHPGMIAISLPQHSLFSTMATSPGWTHLDDFGCRLFHHMDEILRLQLLPCTLH